MDPRFARLHSFALRSAALLRGLLQHTVSGKSVGLNTLEDDAQELLMRYCESPKGPGAQLSWALRLEDCSSPSQHYALPRRSSSSETFAGVLGCAWDGCSLAYAAFGQLSLCVRGEWMSRATLLVLNHNTREHCDFAMLSF